MCDKSLPQVFYCEFWENFKNTFFYRTPLVAAFDVPFLSMLPSILIYPAEYWEAFNIEIKGSMGMKWFDNLRNHL